MRERSVQLNLPATEVEPVNRHRLSTVDPLNRDAEWLGKVTEARERARMSMTAAAIAMGPISLQLYSAQENGAEGKHLSFRRMWRLGRAFWQEMLPLIIEFHQLDVPGMTEQDRRDCELGRTVRLALERRLAG